MGEWVQPTAGRSSVLLRRMVEREGIVAGLVVSTGICLQSGEWATLPIARDISGVSLVAVDRNFEHARGFLAGCPVAYGSSWLWRRLGGVVGLSGSGFLSFSCRRGFRGNAIWRGV